MAEQIMVAFQMCDWEVAEKTSVEFCKECTTASENPEQFKKFRQLPTICSVTENKSDKLAYAAWSALKMACPSLLEKAETIALNDSLGSPTFIHLDEIRPNNSLSAATVCFASDYAALLWFFGSLDGMRIAEIGGGYGGLASIINRLSNVAEYTIYDLPEVHSLQQKYLTTLGCSNIQYKSQLDGQSCKYDLVISSEAFSELSPTLRDAYANQVFRGSERGWIVWGPRLRRGEKHQWSTQKIADWLSERMSPTLVQCGRDLTEYRNIFQDKAITTYLWGGPTPNLLRKPLKEENL